MKKTLTFLLIICCMAVTVCVSACNGNENKLSRYEIYASYDESAGTVTCRLSWIFITTPTTS